MSWSMCCELFDVCGVFGLIDGLNARDAFAADCRVLMCVSYCCG